jgi:hypothetical protein
MLISYTEQSLKKIQWALLQNSIIEPNTLTLTFNIFVNYIFMPYLNNNSSASVQKQIIVYPHTS